MKKRDLRTARGCCKMGKRINLEEEKELMALGKALSSEIRLKILGLLQEESFVCQ